MYNFPLIKIPEIGMCHVNDNIYLLLPVAVTIVCTCLNLIVIPNGISRQLQPPDVKHIVEGPFKKGIPVLVV